MWVSKLLFLVLKLFFFFGGGRFCRHFFFVFFRLGVLVGDLFALPLVITIRTQEKSWFVYLVAFLL